jgi:hypothetical protein
VLSVTVGSSSMMGAFRRLSKNRMPSPSNTGTRLTRITLSKPRLRHCWVMEGVAMLDGLEDGQRCAFRRELQTGQWFSFVHVCSFLS